MATISNQYYKQTKYIKEICFTNSLLNEPKTPARSKAITRQIIVQEKSKKDDEYIIKKMVIFDNDLSVSTDSRSVASIKFCVSTYLLT